MYNGAQISKTKKGYQISQQQQAEKLSLINEKNVNKDEYITERARGAYIAGVCCPEVSYGFSFAAQTTSPGVKEAKFLNEQIKKCKEAARV